jgi:hypothetical protein
VYLKDRINDYRLSNGKKALPLCDSLNYVASSHVANLNIWYKDTSLTLFSWINPREGSEVLIPKRTGDMIGSCMKPNNLLGMNQRGYEMVHMHTKRDEYCSAECAFSYFLSKPLFRDMIIEQDFSKWSRFGICIYKYSASVWFMHR